MENESVVDEILIEAVVKKVLEQQRPVNQLVSSPYDMKPEEREARFKAEALGVLTRLYGEISQPWQLENPSIAKIRDAVRPLLLELL